MNGVDVLGLFADALWLVVLMVSVLVVPSLLVGLAVSVFQAATQINEQTLSFLPRLMVTLMTLMFTGPWMVYQLVEFCERVVRMIPLVLQ